MKKIVLMVVFFIGLSSVVEAAAHATPMDRTIMYQVLNAYTQNDKVITEQERDALFALLGVQFLELCAEELIGIYEKPEVVRSKALCRMFVDMRMIFENVEVLKKYYPHVYDWGNSFCRQYYVHRDATAATLALLFDYKLNAALQEYHISRQNIYTLQEIQSIFDFVLGLYIDRVYYSMQQQKDLMLMEQMYQTMQKSSLESFFE